MASVPLSLANGLTTDETKLIKAGLGAHGGRELLKWLSAEERSVELRILSGSRDTFDTAQAALLQTRRIRDFFYHTLGLVGEQDAL